MLYILNNNEKIVGLIQHNIDKNCKNIYFDDLLQEDLQSGAESLTFSAILENNITNEVCVGNYIAFKKENEYKLMQIIEVGADKIENGIIKNIYCESAGLELINEVYTGLDMESVNFRMFLENILQDTFWEVGNIDVNLVKNLYVKMENKSIYNLIQEHSNKFGAEIAFRVEIKNNKVVGRYIDAYVQRGKDVGKRLEVNKDVKSLTRKMNLMDYATKLIGRGKDGLTFKDISDNNLDKPLGQDFIVNNEAFSRLNYRGKHITKVFEYDTTDPHELLLQTKKALDEYSKIKIEYSIESNIIDFSDIGIGDTIYISDLTFNPPLFVSARICNLETSKTNDNNNKVTLSNYKEIKSSISKFPIGSNDILDGAITKGKIDTQYLETIKTDILVSTKIEVGTLIANKADMEDLFAINATVVNLIADNVTITGKLTAVEGEFDTLQSEVGKIQTLVNGNLTSENIHSLHLTSSSVTVENGFIKNAMIDNLDVSKINAGDISTNKFRIKSDDGGIEIAGATQQFKDKNNKVRVQIGRDKNNNFTFSLFDETGVGVLIDHTGVKEGAIANDLIVSDMISSDSVGEKQINYSSFVTGFNKDTNTSTIKSTKIMLNNQNQTLDIAFNSLKTQADGTKSITESHSTTIGIMQGQISTAINNTQIVKDGQTILLKDDYNRTVATIDSMKSTIGSHTSQINGLNSTVSTQGSSIEQLKGQIALKVEQTDINTAINNLEIGGRNLILNSEPKTTSGWSGNWSKSLVDCSFAPNGKAIRATSGITKDIGSLHKAPISKDKFINGETYTLSAWIRASKSCRIRFSNEMMVNYNTYTNITTEWKFYSITQKINTSNQYWSDTFYVHGDDWSSNMWIEIHSLKLEKGTKPTDFTLAPEDVDDSIATVDAKISSTNSKVATIETNLSSITQRVSSTESTTSTLTTKVNAAQSTADTAKSTADQAKTTATNAQNSANTASTNATNALNKANDANSKMDNLYIGGRNLTPNTGYHNNTTGWGFWNSANTMSIVEGRTSSSKALQIILANQAGSGFKTPVAPCIGGKEYTVSFWFKSTIACKIGDLLKFIDASGTESNPIGMITINVPQNTWTYYTRTFTAPSTAVKMYTTPRVDPAVGTPTVQLTEYKLEIGNKATDWTPAPEDVQSQIDTHTTQITTTNNKVSEIKTDLSGITSRVGSVESKQTTTDGKVIGLESRMSNAESKITESAITNTVKKNFYTKSETDNQITSKGYQTASQVQQTVDKFEAKFEESGGYNLLRNSAFKNGTKFWSALRWDTQAGGANSIDVRKIGDQWTLTNRNSLSACVSGLVNGNTYKQLKAGFDSARFKVRENTTYTLHCLMSCHRAKNITIEMLCYDSSGNRLSGNNNVGVSNLKSGGRDRNNWTVVKHVFTTQANATECHIRAYMNEWTGEGNSAYMWIAEPIVVEGNKDVIWTPNSDEVYTGITTIDKDGITVTSSNVKSKANISASGFKITKTDTNEDVFKVNADGTLNITGSISTLSNGARAQMSNDGMRFYSPSTQAGKICYDSLGEGTVESATNRFLIESLNGYAIKLLSSGNMSLSAGSKNQNKIYLMSDTMQKGLFTSDYIYAAQMESLGDFHVNLNGFTSDDGYRSAFKVNSINGNASIAGTLYTTNLVYTSPSRPVAYAIEKESNKPDSFDVLDSFETRLINNNLVLSVKYQNDVQKALNPCLTQNENKETGIDVNSLLANLIDCVKKLKEENDILKAKLIIA